MKNNRILPVGLKGNQINERMMELMGINQINENKSNIAVELTKMGPDGKAYAIIRENHEYYIKSTDKTSGLIAEDFKYIGGLQNKKQEAYPSYAKAIKHLNLKFNSIQEALDTRIDINVFEDDNLLNEDIAGFSNAYGGGFSGAGNLEGNTALYEEEEVDGEEIPENPEDYTKQPGYIHEEDEDMSDEEKAIDEMLDESWMEEELTGNQDRIDMNHNDEIDAQDFKILRGMDEELYGNQDKIDMNHNDRIDGEDLSMLRGMDEEMGTNPNDELFDRLDNMTGEELVQFLKDAGQDVKNKFMSMISAGADRARNYLDKRYPENESALYEGKLSINRAIDKMDSIIDSLTETDVKKKRLNASLEEAKKYTLKVAAAGAATPPAAPAPDMAAPAAPAPEAGGDLDFGDEAAPADDKPFDDEPFDAGVEADEDTDPKKFIEQLSGKIGQSLRKYTEETGQPDFELEKFAINSLLSATHTAEMDEDDRKDIIKKVNTAGAGDGNDSENPDMGGDENDSEMPDMGDDENLQESEMTNLFLDGKGKRMSIYAPEGSPEFMEINRLDENNPCWTGYEKVAGKGDYEEDSCRKISEKSEGLWANIHAKRERGESPAKPGSEDYPDKKQWNKLTKEEVHGEGESNNYMFWQNLKTIHHASGELLEMGQEEVDNMVANGHAWAVDHISTSADDIEEVYHFMEANLEDSGDYDGETEGGYEDEYGNVEGVAMYEGKYEGKPLGKPMKGDVKKFKVYVKNKKGNVVKVNFGDPNMEIKRDDPERKKSFRARHKCSQAKDRTTPKYWSCKMWSSTPVSKMVAENLTGNEKNSIFGKDLLKAKLHETFNLKDMTETVEPQVQPIVKPTTTPAPSRRSRPFTIDPDSVPQTDPKAITENLNKLQVYHNTFSSAVQTAGEYAKSKGYELNDDEWFNTIATGPKKPQEGETNRYTLTLYKDGKEQRKALHIQVYGMKNKYELNTYIA